MQHPAISILLPARNAAATLAEALESLFVQTFADFEIIAVDDHSRDDTPGILQQAASRDRRLRLLHCPPPGGLVTALRMAHAAARAPILARMDADDIADPRRLEVQYALLEQRPDLAGCGTRVAIDGDAGEGWRRYVDWLNGLLKPEAIARERFIESPLVHPSVMLRSEPFEAVGGYHDPPWPEDYDLWLRLMNAGYRLAKTPEVLLRWRDRHERLTRTDGRYSTAAFLAAKAHYLTRLECVRQRGVMINGAGPTGKQLAMLLRRQGVRVAALIDVHPGRIGRTIGGVPVRGIEDIPRAGEGATPVQLAAVGQPGRRDVIRQLMAERGWTEGTDFFCVA